MEVRTLRGFLTQTELKNSKKGKKWDFCKNFAFKMVNEKCCKGKQVTYQLGKKYGCTSGYIRLYSQLYSELYSTGLEVILTDVII